MSDIVDKLRFAAVGSIYPRTMNEAADTIEAQAEQIRVLREALQDIIDPIAAWQRDLKDGYTLDGAMCVHMAKDPETYRRIARAALEATK